MARRSYTQERIIDNLREAEILLSQGSSVGEAARKIGVTDVSIEYIGLTHAVYEDTILVLWSNCGHCVSR